MKGRLVENQLDSKCKEEAVALLKATFQSLSAVTKKNTIKLSHGVWSPGEALKVVFPAQETGLPPTRPLRFGSRIYLKETGQNLLTI
jgi:hypothetical protein